MTLMPGHARLTRSAQRMLNLAAALVAAGMLVGLTSSFVTLYRGAEAHHWTAPGALPLAVDLGIPAYVILDHVAVTLGGRSWLLRGAAFALAAFTVWANAAITTADPTWRVIHAAMPALWILGTEGLRVIWLLLRDDPATRARDRAYQTGCADARTYARDLVRDHLGLFWRLTIPGRLRRQIRRLPAAVTAAVDAGLTAGGAAAWEPVVETMVTDGLTRGDKSRADIDARRRQLGIDSNPADEATEPSSKDRRNDRQNTGSARARRHAKAERLVAASPGISAGELASKCGVSVRTGERWLSGMKRPRLVAGDAR